MVLGREFVWECGPYWDLRDPPTRACVRGPKIASVDVGEGLTCAIEATGEAWCWGRNHNGQLGQHPNGLSTSMTPVRVGSGSEGAFTHVTAGSMVACFIHTNGSVACQGQAAFGALGDGTTIDRVGLHWCTCHRVVRRCLGCGHGHVWPSSMTEAWRVGVRMPKADRQQHDRRAHPSGRPTTGLGGRRAQSGLVPFLCMERDRHGMVLGLELLRSAREREHRSYESTHAHRGARTSELHGRPLPWAHPRHVGRFRVGVCLVHRWLGLVLGDASPPSLGDGVSKHQWT